MGFIARVLSFTRRVINGIPQADVKCNPDGGANETGKHFADPGDDSHPLTTDYASFNDNRKTGKSDPVGYFDPKLQPKALPGDKRIYGRDTSSGAYVNEVWLKNTGEVLVSNDNGSGTLRADGSFKIQNSSGFIELKTDGTVDINGAIISATGEVTNSAGIVLGTHTHNINSGSSAPGPTAGPN